MEQDQPHTAKSSRILRVAADQRGGSRETCNGDTRRAERGDKRRKRSGCYRPIGLLRLYGLA